eukprot:CAMPEP_0172735826 /NCGR_PEP_ID=MMETSP1074-20121228/113423_1 /TAXON_ID=2916 /ORGANISM="Ceratium fusus, Strain PA161109" /LENGTH=381 /DNA_ID=CAMNT_0013564897 /DNA_START=28 /DNA_END=1171 /DNA_ORIENTATION=+
MSKPRTKKTSGQSVPNKVPHTSPNIRTAAGVAMLAILIGVIAWRSWKTQQASKSEDGLGPSVMTGQVDLIQRLTSLLLEVDNFKGEGQQAKRRIVSRRVQQEVDQIEAESAIDTNTAAGKQQAGLIALVRSALQSDENNATFDDWTEEGLLQAHGLATYASQSYWDDAYAHNKYGESFDWYGTWEEKDLEGHSLRDIVGPAISQNSNILMMGCGNSNLSVTLYEEGYRKMANIDISEPVIAYMRNKHSHLQDMTWTTMDASSLDFKNGSFDVAIEKGLFDALYAGTGERVQAVLAEARRVLRPGGRMVSISFAGDRIERLFLPTEGSPGAELLPPLECQIAGVLRYNNGTAEGETAKVSKKSGAAFHDMFAQYLELGGSMG